MGRVQAGFSLAALPRVLGPGWMTRKSEWSEFPEVKIVVDFSRDRIFYRINILFPNCIRTLWACPRVLHATPPRTQDKLLSHHRSAGESGGMP